MSAPDSESSAPACPASKRTRASWWREPLLHFALLGGVVFALDHAVVARQSDPRTIVVGSEVDEEARRLFAAARGREPNAAEMTALRQRWIDNEVLYREGLALGVDRGDAAIRDRVIFKALSVVSANAKLPPIDDPGLRAWFESKRANYDEPARYDFQEAVVAGERTEVVIRNFVQALNAGTAPDVEAGLRVFKGRPHESIVQSYGAEFAEALEAGPVGEWRALPTRGGWRAVRLDAVTPPKAADYEALRGIVMQDWTDAAMAQQRTAAVRALAAKYKIRYEIAEP